MSLDAGKTVKGCQPLDMAKQQQGLGKLGQASVGWALLGQRAHDCMRCDLPAAQSGLHSQS